MGGCRRTEGMGRRKNGRACVPHINCSDFSKYFSSMALELPGLIPSRVLEKHSSPSFPLQFVESPSQG